MSLGREVMPFSNASASWGTGRNTEEAYRWPTPWQSQLKCGRRGAAGHTGPPTNEPTGLHVMQIRASGTDVHVVLRLFAQLGAPA